MSVETVGDAYALAVLTPAEAQLLLEYHARNTRPVERMREIRQIDPWDTFALTPEESSVLDDVRSLTPQGFAAWMDALDALRAMPGRAA